MIEQGGRLDDHQPLGTGIAPWRENLTLLASAGYRGGILFEINVMSFGGPAGLAAMLRSVTREIDGIFTRVSHHRAT